MKRFTLIVSSLIACSPAVALGDGDSRVVDCARGQSIAEALEKGGSGRPLSVVVRGECREGVVISRDDVALVGDGGAIIGSLTIAGAHRVVVADLKISNPAGDGVLVTDNASATIRNNEINDSSGYGIRVRNASFAQVDENKMLRNGIINNTDIDASGISVSQGSTVRAIHNEIAENANTGVEVFEGGLYRSELDTISQRASAPGRSAIDTFRRGHVELRGATVSGAVFVNQQSHFQARTQGDLGSVSGRIDVAGLAFFRLRAGVTRHASTLSCNALSICQCDGLPGNICPPVVP